MSITLKAPLGTNEFVGRSGTVYVPAANGSLTVSDNSDVLGLLSQGCSLFATKIRKASFNSPLPADLISIKAAATPANGTIAIAAQPPQVRKLQVRIVLGTPGTTNITAGTLTLVYTDQDGNVINEVVQLNQFGALSGTYLTKSACGLLTSGTVAGYAANGSGTGNTLGIGVSNDFAIPSEVGTVLNFTLLKASKTTKVLGTSNITVDDVAATATVDTVARTVNPTTAPAANGLVDYEFTCAYN